MKKFYKFLVIVLFCFFPFSKSYAEEFVIDDSVLDINEIIKQNDNEILTSEEVKNGFVVDDTGSYYYIDGIMQVGFISINTALYYFDEFGRMVTGWYDSDLDGKNDYYFDLKTGVALVGHQMVDGYRYYFELDGRVHRDLLSLDGKTYMYSRSTGRMMFGWFDYDWDGKSDYYFDLESGEALIGSQMIQEDYYYFNSLGVLITGWYDYDLDGKNDYYFDLETGKAFNGQQMVDGSHYYFELDGRVHRDLLSLDGKTYMYSRSTGRMMFGWFDYDWDGKNDYYFDLETGEALVGHQTFGEYQYYFDLDGKMHKDLLNLDGKIYMYSRSTGRMMFDWFDYDWDGKSDYYFDLETGQAVVGHQMLGNHHYYFDIDGKLYKGLLQDDNGGVYYFDELGHVVTGWYDFDLDGKNDYYFNLETGQAVIGHQTFGEYQYYFDPDGKMHKDLLNLDEKTYMYSRSTGRMMFGWFDYDWDGKNDYYFDLETGEALVGHQTIEEYQYYFDIDGKIHRDLLSLDGKTYMYSRSTGRMMFGWFDYDWDGKNDYYFKLESGEALVGHQMIEEYQYYFDLDGKLYKDLFVDGENIYMYSRSTGRMMFGWFDYDWDSRKDYYFDLETGIALKDLLTIDGNTYMFGRSSAKVQYGWFDYNWDGKNDYYFDLETGIMAIGMKIIDGVRNYFRADGTFVSDNVALYVDVSKYQGTIDWETVKTTDVYGAILRLGYGTSYTDPCVEDSTFAYNYSNSLKNGLFQGIYFYSYAIGKDSALREANYVIERLKNYNISKDTMIYYDIESNPWTSSLNSQDYDSIISTFLSALNQAGYYNVYVYTYKYWAENRLSDWAKEKIRWIAQYADVCTYQGTYKGWQFTDNGSINGISGAVDLSYFI